MCRSNIFISKIPSYAILVWSGLQYTTRVGSSESPTLEQSLDETDEDVYLMQNIVDITGRENNNSNKNSFQQNKAIVKPIQKQAVVPKKININNDDDDDDDFNQFLEKGMYEFEKKSNKILSLEVIIIGVMIADQTDLKETFKDLIDISKLESCCFKKIDSYSTLSTCVHIKKGSFKTLHGKVLQSKLKWYQVILLICRV